MGLVALVGAGPGDKRLLTIKGREYIERADCILYDRNIGIEILNWSKEGCELISVGKSKNKHTLKQSEINELLYKKSLEYELVVRLKGGDPYVFGRGGEEALYLNEKNVEVDVVPGISSSVAALAYAGIPITHRGISRGFHVITAHGENGTDPCINYSSLLDEEITLVFLMGLTQLKNIVKGLLDAGRRKDTPVAVISGGTTTSQKKCIGTLENIASLVDKANIPTPGIIVVGGVVDLNEQLSYFEKKPLFGRRIFVPRVVGGEFSFTKGWSEIKDNRIEEAITQKGGIPVSCDLGKISPAVIDTGVIERLSSDDYIVFTSQNAVHALMWNLNKSGRDVRALGRVKTAVVGKKTGEALKGFGIVPDIVSDIQTGAALANTLLKAVGKETKVLWFTTQGANPDLYLSLKDACIIDKIDCYINSPVSKDDVPSKEDLDGCTGIMFTCASNVKRTLEKYGPGLPEIIYSIGPSCSKALAAAGYDSYIQAGESSYEGLIGLL